MRPHKPATAIMSQMRFWAGKRPKAAARTDRFPLVSGYSASRRPKTVSYNFV